MDGSPLSVRHPARRGRLGAAKSVAVELRGLPLRPPPPGWSAGGHSPRPSTPSKRSSHNRRPIANASGTDRTFAPSCFSSQPARRSGELTIDRVRAKKLSGGKALRAATGGVLMGAGTWMAQLLRDTHGNTGRYLGKRMACESRKLRMWLLLVFGLGVSIGEAQTVQELFGR